MRKKDIFNFKKSVLAIFLGFVVAFAVAAIFEPNLFFKLLKSIFIEPLVGPGILKVVILGSILTIVGLAVCVGFKASLFNIGVPGQMLAGAMIPSMIASSIAVNGWFPGAWAVLILIGLISGSLIGSFVGFLKSKYNVNEVISTIMLNWIIYFFGKYIFQKAAFTDGGYPGSKIWHTSLRVNPYVVLIIAVVMIFTIWYIFNKTVFGYKMKLIGKQPSVAEYTGYSRAKIQTMTLAISGALGGLAGALYYGTYTAQYVVPTFDYLNPIGFNAIIITLVAFNKPILIGFISSLFAVIYTGGYLGAIHLEYSGELMSLAFGIVMYTIAMTDSYTYKKKKKGKGSK